MYPNDQGFLNENAQQAAERRADQSLPQRLERDRTERPRCFVSGLNAREFALSEGDDAASLGVVTGASVYHVGWQSQIMSQIMRQSAEMKTLTQAHIQVRSRALARLEREAALLGAHGVVGVTLRTKTVGDEVLEFTASGTALRLTQGQVPPRPFLCTLSASDFWTLRRAGYRPCGVVLGACVHYQRYSAEFANLRSLRLGRGPAFSMEYVEAVEAGRITRQTALDRLTDEAAQGQAEGVIGLSLDIHVHAPLARSDSPYRRYDRIVRCVALGTAITPHRDRWPLLDYAVPLTD